MRLREARLLQDFLLLRVVGESAFGWARACS